ncbi:ATP-binding protein [Undibacterium arcticum]
MPPHLPQVFADHDRLMQVMLNLLSNAVKFCDRAAGRIAVSLEAERNQLRVAVRDNGPGVRPQDQELIFPQIPSGRRCLDWQAEGHRARVAN